MEARTQTPPFLNLIAVDLPPNGIKPDLMKGLKRRSIFRTQGVEYVQTYLEKVQTSWVICEARRNAVKKSTRKSLHLSNNGLGHVVELSPGLAQFGTIELILDAWERVVADIEADVSCESDGRVTTSLGSASERS